MRRICLSIILLLIYVPAWGATYYVDVTGGSDSNSGTTITAPWKTIYKVNASSFSAGDSILFKRGETWREQLTVPSSGSPGNPITFGAYGMGAKPIINGSDLITSWTSGVANTWVATVTTKPYAVWFDGTIGNLKANMTSLGSPGDWFWSSNILYVYSTSNPSTNYTNTVIESANRKTAYISDKSFIIFDNIKFDKGGNSDNGDVSIALRQSKYITMQNCDIIDSVNIGINIFNINGATGDTLIQYCTFRGTGESKSTTGAPSGIQTYNTGDTPTFTVQYSTFQDMDAWGAHHGHGIYHQSGKLIWRYNYHYGDRGSTQAGAGAGAGVRLHSTGGANVYYNIFSNDGGRRYWGILPDGGTNNIYNNIFHGNYNAIRTEGGANTVINNTFSGTSANTMTYINDINRSYSGDYNVFYGASNGWIWNNGSDITTLASWKTNSSQDTHSINSDPLFVSTSTPNFHLQPSSPAINAGTDVGLTSDYAGNIVPQGSAPDIGGFEYLVIPKNPSPPSILIIK